MRSASLRLACAALAAASTSCIGSGGPSVPPPGGPAGVRGPPPVWTRQLGTTGVEAGLSVATDASRNVLVAGTTDGVLGGEASAGAADVFVAKYDAQARWRWTRQLGTAAVEEGASVAADPSGNVLVGGATGGSLDGNAAAGFGDAFVVKFDGAGAKLWSRQLGTAQREYDVSIAADPSGAVLVAGTTEGALDGSASAGAADVFVVKYDGAGTKLWSRQLGTAAGDHATSLATDAAGNVVVAGFTSGAFEGSANAGQFDLFVAKWDAGGALQWVRQLGTDRYDWGMGVATDAAGDVYVGGTTEGALDGGTSGGCLDAFVVKYDAAGTRQWTRQLGTPPSPICHDDVAEALAADAAGDVVVAGWTRGSFDGIAPAGDLDLFAVEYDAAGEERWTGQLGTTGSDVANALAFDADGFVLVGGTTWGRLDGTGAGGRGDAFVLKYDVPTRP